MRWFVAAVFCGVGVEVEEEDEEEVVKELSPEQAWLSESSLEHTW